VAAESAEFALWRKRGGKPGEIGIKAVTEKKTAPTWE
jgi:hypothetical protein